MRALKIAMVVMGVLIVAGVVALGVVVAGRISPDRRVILPPALDEPAGTHIVAASTAGDRMTLVLQGGGQPDRVVVMDTGRGQVVLRMGLAR